MSTSKSTANGQSRRERRAAERAARKGQGSGRASTARSGPSMGLITGAAIVLGLVGVLGFIALSGGSGADELPPVSAPEDPAPREELQAGRSVGDPAAPVRIEVFEDPQCPACGIFSRQVEPLLIAGPVAAGNVFYTYHDMVFLGPESLDAAAAMRVAEELDGKFWEYRHVLFHNQHGENEGAFSRARLADMAELIGLDRAAFLAAMEDPRHAEAVQAQTGESAALGVDSTPTLSVEGELLPGVRSWDELDARIEEALAAAQEAA